MGGPSAALNAPELPHWLARSQSVSPPPMVTLLPRWAEGPGT